MGAMNPKEFRELVRTLAVTAAKVVEEEHTPTDDERETILLEKIKLAGHLAAEVMIFQGDSYPVKAIPYASFLHILDGFSSSEVPEPSAASEFIDVEMGDSYAHLVGRVKARPEPQGEPSDAQEAVQRLKDAGVGAYIILATVAKVYDMEAKNHG